MSFPRSWLSLFIIGSLFLSACQTIILPVPIPSGSAAGAERPAMAEPEEVEAEEIKTEVTETPATAVPAAETAAAPIIGSGIEGGHPDFNLGVVLWQGYWLSRDHFGPFVMASGMGIPFEPPMEMMNMGIQMIAQNPNDQVMVPQNMFPLQAVYASGSPKLINNPMDFDPMDFAGMRLDPESFDQTVRVRGQAETMLKETQWAHNFADAHFGMPDGDFGAQQRFTGVMVNMLAQMQAQYAMQNLMGADGLFYDSDGALDYTANWVMLHAVADLAVLTRGEVQPRYMNPDMYPMFDQGAAMLFQALSGRTPESAREAAAAIRALTYFAWATGDAAMQEMALNQGKAIADGQLVGFASDDVVEIAAAMTGLITLGNALGDSQYQSAADPLFHLLAADFDAAHGIFKSKNVYNVDAVAWLIGGLNWATQQGSDTIKPDAAAMLTAVYESMINLSGIQLSAPPGKDGAMAGEYEKNLPSEL